MTENIYKRKSIRLKDYDYLQSGYYFVTICSHNRKKLFGMLDDGIMELNEFGILLREELIVKLKHKYSHIDIDQFVIKPNHIHLILVIDESRGEVTSPLPTLGNILAFYKYQSTKKINQLRDSPGIRVWQRNYYEHIIRNEKELYEIRIYI